MDILHIVTHVEQIRGGLQYKVFGNELVELFEMSLLQYAIGSYQPLVKQVGRMNF